jgi:ribosome-associated protein
MAESIRIARGVVVPAGALEWRAVRSSGPGGQNVNKVASKVELRVELAEISGLDTAARARLAALVAAKLDADGRLLVTSQRTRDQARNLDDARTKVLRLVERALRVPRPRRLTAPSRAAVERRLRTKRVRSTVKRGRVARADEDA